MSAPRPRSRTALAVLCGGLLAALAGCDAPAATPPAGSSRRLAAEVDSARLEPADLPLRVEPVMLARDLREAIVVEGAGSIAFELEPEAAHTFWVSLGARRPRPDEGTEAGPEWCELSVAVAGRGAAEELASERISFEEGAAETGWHELCLEVPGGAPGEERWLRVASRPGGGRTTVLWGSPRLQVRPGARGERRRPSVVLVSIDTVGTRHMSVYGYGRPTTPALEEFAREAVVFDQAIAHQSWTLTSHASMLTALYPDMHRVNKETMLAEEVPLLPELLRDSGYFSIGLVNNPYLNTGFGYGRGYDVYDFDHTWNDAEDRKITRDAEASLAILEEHLRCGLATPFFLFFHLMDPHSDWQDLPYDAPPPFAGRFLEGVDTSVPVQQRGLQATRLLGAVNKGQAELSAEQAAYFAALYDAGLAFTDQQVSRFFDLLRERGLYDDALIFVTSDHGEEFLEHGRTMHVQAYDETVRVPLLVRFPGGELGGRRVDDQVRLVDLMPTILDYLGHEIPEGIDGVSLMPVVRGEAHPIEVTVTKGENRSLSDTDVYAARTREWKLLWRLGGTDGEDRFELYRLTADPGEQEDVAADHPEIVETLHGFLRRHRERGARRGAGGAAVEIDDEQAEVLEALGYAGN